MQRMSEEVPVNPVVVTTELLGWLIAISDL
jgi:hypothetical protein